MSPIEYTPSIFVIVKPDLSSTISASVFDNEPEASAMTSSLTSFVQELNANPRMVAATS
ncbi:hypothetical protein AALK14_00015 [Butyricimonas hominis]|uniref:hypothetical protein n=1 Tax=Butyricimonas hominis TaxID=2763032 RepID=UPI0035195077